ncbi:peptide antibiotic transporter SbmA [Rhizobium ruizarguesonis]|uniref:Peptide antibiotic transporter SbmA n=1 Tax=Rhizobium ruizarguesonis TaxID=2081791 RepID=A0AAE4YSJ1_9HYPH|nr:peptide antibiotic transporter SbmA [Rhizobium ruizarguesonis]MBY5830861.1 peptide antibiotic transporter SbmA [Rhizobium leguminosarum]NKJ72567.1 peptide antibiotic transporter SbmA [Rhizobium leguminosarum bv. viciae]QIO46859.1 peptide antibiotic transporter SbmA [Rhizobium leguminosarum bv. trifolii]QJS28816.1 peptide antibiotic transporter SbmA [Rhizobium leguminosarum bv. trifolii TA1]MBY5859565.1 peptide antibiotic transporter SbmA [Rhizobium leguminosarum]
MFHSFFPQPKAFFTSLVVWTLISIAGWYLFAASLGVSLGYAPVAEEQQPIDLSFFLLPENVWFYGYFLLSAAIFCAAWHLKALNHPWKIWSIWGSALIIFVTYFGVQISVVINNWRRPFGDLLQNALSKQPGISVDNFYTLMWVFCQIAFLSMFVSIMTDFFTSHYIFRWRTAMNNFYMSKWEKLRHIEGASQRVQEDTMRFSSTLEGLGISLINSVMTLVVFLPILLALSHYVTELPFIGPVANSLFWLALFWSAFGTLLLAVAGVKLPGLNFRNQRVEAAYRKELVYGEDHAERAEPLTVGELFGNVRRNYYRMYFHYMYFNVARYFYIQADALFVVFMLVPTIVAGTITYGIFQQISTAFGQVSNSFQYLVNSWTTIIELLSIHKRLKAFEAAIDDEPLPEIDQRYLERETGVVHADG